MIRHLRALARSQDGTAAIELALVAPVLAIMVAGVADISIAYGRELEIEQAAQRAIEKVMQTSGDDTPENTIKKEACMQINGQVTTTTTTPVTDPATGVTTNVTTTSVGCASGRITTSDVTVVFELTCNGTVTAYNTDCPTGQTEVRYVSVTVQDEYDPMFPLTFATASDGKYHLSATAGVRVK